LRDILCIIAVSGNSPYESQKLAVVPASQFPEGSPFTRQGALNELGVPVGFLLRGGPS
jgi:hypothetical protein